MDLQQKTIHYLISSISFLGAERVLAELAKELDRDKFQLHIGLMVGHTDITEQLRSEIDRADVSIVKFERATRLDFRIAKDIAHYIDSNGIDIVHSQGYKPDVHVALAKLFTRKKFVLVSACHTWKLRTLKERFYRLINLAVLRIFDGIVAISSDVKLELESVGIPSYKISIIDNGIALVDNDGASARKKARDKLGIEESNIVIGCVASLTVEKANMDLIRAYSAVVSRVPAAILVLVGDGDRLECLKQLVSELSLGGRVVFCGRRNDVRLLYHAFDVFALVSYTEGLPMAMLEAMSAKIPVIASSVGAIPNVIEDGKNGILVESGNIEAIKNAIFSLLANADMRIKLGAAGYKTIVEKFSSKRMARDYEDFYETILKVS